MILACSGDSNVGQRSNQAAVELTLEGFGKMFCLAKIGGHLSGFEFLQGRSRVLRPVYPCHLKETVTMLLVYPDPSFGHI